MRDKDNLDQVRSSALERIDRSERNFKLAFLAAAIVEGLFLVAYLLLMDMGNRLHLLLLIATVGSYTIVVLGLVVLGTHFSRGNLRVLKAIELLRDRSK